MGQEHARVPLLANTAGFQSPGNRDEVLGCPPSSGPAPFSPEGWDGGQPISTVTDVTHIPGQEA